MGHQPTIFVVSHACVVDVNQEPFRALAEAGARVFLVAPRSLRTDVRGRIDFRSLDGFAEHVTAVPVMIGGYTRALGGQRGVHLIVYRGLRSLMGRARPDVAYAEEEPFSFAALQLSRLAWRARVPFVFHANQNVTKSLPPPFPGIRSAVFRHSSGATVRNRTAGELLGGQGFTGPVEEFPHAVDLARYASAERLEGLEAPVVGFVGRLVPEKGVDDLVEALARVRERTGRGSLLLVGDGPEAASLKAQAHRLGVPSRWLGAVPHDRVPALYGAMDIVAIPSRSTPGWKEQFGRIVIEANAAGVPVVASDSGELPTTVAATGGGMVVPEGDVEALASGLARLVSDAAVRRSLGQAGRHGVAARFTPEAVAKRLLDFLSFVAATRPG